MSKVKFQFALPQRAAMLNTGSEVVKIVENCTWLSEEDAKEFTDNKLGQIVEGVEPPEETAASPANDSKQNDDLLKALLKKNVDELQSLAVESELPAEEWSALKKLELVKYLIEKAFNKQD